MKANAFVLMGNWHERQGAINFIKNSLKDYELYLYDDDYSWEYVRQSITEYSCFGGTRLIIINGLPKTTGEASSARTKVLNGLAKALPRVNENTCVILNGVTITSKKFLSAIEGKVKVCVFDKNVLKVDARKLVEDYFAKKDKKIDSNDAYMLVNSINFNTKEINVDKVYLLAKKIEDVVGGRKIITHNDVVSVCSMDQEFLIWNLFNALDSKDYKECLGLIDAIYRDSLDFGHEVVMALSTMVWKFRLMLFVKSCLEKGLSTEDIWMRTSKFVKWVKSGKGIKRIATPKRTKKDNKLVSMYSRPYLNTMFRGFGGRPPVIACYTKDELVNAISLIQISLKKIRAGCTKGEIRIAMELLCLVICRGVSYGDAQLILKNNYCL